MPFSAFLREGGSTGRGSKTASFITVRQVEDGLGRFLLPVFRFTVSAFRFSVYKRGLKVAGEGAEVGEGAEADEHVGGEDAFAGGVDVDGTVEARRHTEHIFGLLGA